MVIFSSAWFKNCHFRSFPDKFRQLNLIERILLPVGFTLIRNFQLYYRETGESFFFLSTVLNKEMNQTLQAGCELSTFIDTSISARLLLRFQGFKINKTASTYNFLVRKICKWIIKYEVCKEEKLYVEWWKVTWGWGDKEVTWAQRGVAWDIFPSPGLGGGWGGQRLQNQNYNPQNINV